MRCGDRDPLVTARRPLVIEILDWKERGRCGGARRSKLSESGCNNNNVAARASAAPAKYRIECYRVD